MQRYYVREWVSGNRILALSLDDAYETRDYVQERALAAGVDLTRERYGVLIEAAL